MRTWCYQKVDFIKAFKQELKNFYKNLLVQKKISKCKKKFFFNKKVAIQTFNSQHCTTDLIDLFGKRYNIDECDQTFSWLCLNDVDNYLTFKRICELAKHCCC